MASDYVICCPNCDASMTTGDVCPECGHIEDDASCTCDHCLMADPGDQEDDDDPDLDEPDEEDEG